MEHREVEPFDAHVSPSGKGPTEQIYGPDVKIAIARDLRSLGRLDRGVRFLQFMPKPEPARASYSADQKKQDDVRSFGGNPGLRRSRHGREEQYDEGDRPRGRDSLQCFLHLGLH